jgi:putative peptidoglycan lipid II flippase
LAIPLPHLLGIDPKWGAAGLTASAGIAGWVEFALLRRSLNKRIGTTGLGSGFIAKLWLSALTGAALGWGIKLLLPQLHPIIVAGVVLVPYGLVYFAVASVFRISEASVVIERALRIVRFRR